LKRSFAAILAIGGLCATSCTLLVSTSDLRNGDDTRPATPDAAPPRPDATTDVDVRDAGDGGGALLTGCRRFNPTPFFCADFDELNQPVSLGFEDVIKPNGVIEPNLTDWTSPPRAVRFRSKAPDEALLERDIGAIGPKLHYELRIRFNKIGSNGSMQAMRISPVNGESSLIVYVAADRTIFQEDPPGTQFAFDPDFVTGRWYHIAIDLLTASSGSSFVGTVDGKKASEGQLTGHDPSANAKIIFGGMYFFQSTTDWDFTVDDVMVDRR